MTSIKSFPFETILEWYKKNGRHNLPWRQIYSLPVKDRLYQVWIAEVMLQQTQVDRVIGYYNRFLVKYPTIESLAQTTYEELFPYYQGLGYYGRARRMIALAKIIVEKYGSVFPEDLTTLKKLPGIGTYTAHALLAFGYNQPLLAIDANLQKIFARYYFGSRYKPVSGILITGLEKQLRKETISGRDINNALMDFGALVSTTFDKVDKNTYPFPECKWFQTEGKLEIKQKLPVTPAKAGVHPRKTVIDFSAAADGNNGEKYSCVVFLHENHKKYWSSHQKQYEPFLIEPIGKDDRKSIQDYFSVTYGLEVSVRPSFGHAVYQGITVKLFHAQIQTGKISLPVFSKEEKEVWKKNTLIISAK